jgi:quercetin dioxygenase-like cupin family protein
MAAPSYGGRSQAYHDDTVTAAKNYLSGDNVMEPKTWDIIEEERVSPSATRKMLWGQNIMATRWELAPDAVLPLHDHVSEQLTIVERGSVTLSFPGVSDVTLKEGQMLIIPPSVPHSVKVGPGGCTALDLFSPIRQDFIEARSSHVHKHQEAHTNAESERTAKEREREKYVRLQGFLASSGIEIPMEQLLEVPLQLLARYVYERECITMGQIRDVLGIDKRQAKELLRQWKHGDDHSESSLRRKMERLVVFPWEKQ